MLKWRLFQVVMAAVIAGPFGFVTLFYAPRWLRNVVAYPLDGSYQIVRQIVTEYDINRLLFGRDSQGTFLDTMLLIAYAYFFALSLLLIVAFAKILRWRKDRVSGPQASN